MLQISKSITLLVENEMILRNKLDGLVGHPDTCGWAPPGARPAQLAFTARLSTQFRYVLPEPGEAVAPCGRGLDPQVRVPPVTGSSVPCAAGADTL